MDGIKISKVANILVIVIDSLLNIIPYTNAITIPIYDKNEYNTGDKCDIEKNRNK